MKNNCTLFSPTLKVGKTKLVLFYSKTLRGRVMATIFMNMVVSFPLSILLRKEGYFHFFEVGGNKVVLFSS